MPSEIQTVLCLIGHRDPDTREPPLPPLQVPKGCCGRASQSSRRAGAEPLRAQHKRRGGFAAAPCLSCHKAGQAAVGLAGPEARRRLSATSRCSRVCHLLPVRCCPLTRAAEDRLVPPASLGEEHTDQNLLEGTAGYREEHPFRAALPGFGTQLSHL